MVFFNACPRLRRLSTCPGSALCSCSFSYLGSPSLSMLVLIPCSSLLPCPPLHSRSPLLLCVVGNAYPCLIVACPRAHACTCCQARPCVQVRPRGHAGFLQGSPSFLDACLRAQVCFCCHLRSCVQTCPCFHARSCNTYPYFNRCVSSCPCLSLLSCSPIVFMLAATAMRGFCKACPRCHARPRVHVRRHGYA